MICTILGTYIFNHTGILNLTLPQSKLPVIYTQAYNFPPSTLLFSFSLSRNNLLRILPLGDLGISDKNSTPPLIHLYDALWSATCLYTIFATSSSDLSATDADLTTNALGTSPALSSGTWITAQSATAGWARMCASSSAGATWWPCLFQHVSIHPIEYI